MDISVGYEERGGEIIAKRTENSRNMRKKKKTTTTKRSKYRKKKRRGGNVVRQPSINDYITNIQFIFFCCARMLFYLHYILLFLLLFEYVVAQMHQPVVSMYEVFFSARCAMRRTGRSVGSDLKRTNWTVAHIFYYNGSAHLNMI